MWRSIGVDQPSILFYGIDTLSHANFQRCLPKTRDYLLNELGAIEFFGLNKVGRGTMENLIPMTSGCSFISEATGFPSANEECHLIWENFASRGYRTALTDEQIWLLAYRAMRRDNEGKPEAQYDNLSFIKGIQSTCGYVLYNSGCFEHQYVPNHIKERVFQVAQKFSGHPYYHHTWSVMLTHEVIGMAQHLDNPVLETMQGLKEQKLLNNTIIILMSDHGMISEDYAGTPDGLLEARMPALVFVFPEWFKRKYPSAMVNLQRNSQTLTTPYDVHQTLRDLLDLSSITNERLKCRPAQEQPGQIGMSLFLPIPMNRTCESAHVPEQYCICRTGTVINNASADPSVVRAATKAVNHLNSVAWDDKYQGYCAEMDLKRIIDGKKRTDGKGNTLYEIRFEVGPSQGIFGALLKVESESGLLTVSEMKFSVVGEIERQNKYGNQSSCLDKLGKGVAVGFIRSVCFCTNRGS